MEKKRFWRSFEKIRNFDHSDRNSLLKNIVNILKENFEHYDWVGFYLVKEGKLVLSEYNGEPTIHTKINFGEGICGQAAERKINFHS